MATETRIRPAPMSRWWDMLGKRHSNLLVQDHPRACSEADILHHTWNLDRPWYSISSTFNDNPWPGHMVLSSVNHPCFATPMPSAAVPGCGFSLAAIAAPRGGSPTDTSCTEGCFCVIARATCCLRAERRQGGSQRLRGLPAAAAKCGGSFVTRVLDDKTAPFSGR